MGRKVWFPVVSGPLAPYAVGFASWLASRAYSLSAAADRLCRFDQLSRWLEREGLGVGELTVEQAGLVDYLPPKGNWDALVNRVSPELCRAGHRAG